MATKDAVDPLIHHDYLVGLAEAYAADADRRDPLVSPLHADLAGLPPTLVQVGACETLLDDAVRIAGKLGAANAPAIAGDLAGHDPRLAALVAAAGGGRQAIASAGRFMRGETGRLSYGWAKARPRQCSGPCRSIASGWRCIQCRLLLPYNF